MQCITILLTFNLLIYNCRTQDQPCGLLSVLLNKGNNDTSKDWISEKQNVFNNTDIKCSERRLINESRQKMTGWKIVDGEKRYRSYRNGQLIEATGKEAFLLSLGSTKKNKRSSEEGVDKKRKKAS